MKYNLDGQKGPEGEINPDNIAAGPYIYDNAPGLDPENKGLTEDKKPVDPELHETKQTGIPLKGNAFDVIANSINNLNDISDNPVIKSLNITPSQRVVLGEKLGVTASDIKKAQRGPIIGPRRSVYQIGAGLDPISQMSFETNFIKDFVANRKKIKEEESKGVDTRSLEQKETDYIKNYLETGVLGPVDFKEEMVSVSDLAGDIDYQTQIQNETEIIKNYIDKKVDEGIKNNLSNEDIQKSVVDDVSKSSVEGGPQTPPPGISGDPQIKEPPQGGIQTVDLLNAPDGAYIWNIDGNLYVAYEVPGARGEVYDGPPLFMAYTVPNNNLVEAGLLSPEAPAPFISQLLKEDFDAVTILQSGNTDQLTSLIDHPFASFAEQLESQIAVAPWLEETEAIGLLAEAALEGREVTDAEWQGTNWWKTHSDAERDWLITYNSDPATAQQLTTDAQLAVANSLQAAGVSNAPEAIINWVADKYISGQWSQAYTTEQVSLFADPYATGKRDEKFENYLSSTAITGVDRTSERELEVKELYAKWLGPTLGKLTSEEVSEIAGQLRDDPEYKDSLIQNLKQNRLAAFSAYTNPELTYEDIARPWRNLTTSVWGQTADETQGWWQEMVKTNDFAKAQETLREKGIEQDITQVTQDATKALQQALGQGQVSQSGVNV